MRQPFFSVIIPVKETTYCLLFETLPALAKQTYKKFEVIILPNEHSQYDLTLLRKYKWLKIIPTGKITRPAEKRNVGVRNAKGEVGAFIDDDAYPDEEWLKQASKLFNKNVGAVCGPGILPAKVDLWEKIFDEVLKSWIGSGEFGYRFFEQKRRYVDDYPSMNFLVKKRLFLQIDGFNGDYWPGEDSKLCEDIVYKERQKILYHPSVVVYHHRRKDLRSYINQHANYGFHRGAFFAHGDKNSRRLSYLIPTVFVFYILFTILFFLLTSIFKPQISSFQPAATLVYFPFILYLIFATQLFFNALLNTKSLFIAFFSSLVLFLTHFTYGIMFIKGFYKGFLAKEKIYD